MKIFPILIPVILTITISRITMGITLDEFKITDKKDAELQTVLDDLKSMEYQAMWIAGWENVWKPKKKQMEIMLNLEAEIGKIRSEFESQKDLTKQHSGTYKLLKDIHSGIKGIISKLDPQFESALNDLLDNMKSTVSRTSGAPLEAPSCVLMHDYFKDFDSTKSDKLLLKLNDIEDDWSIIEKQMLIVLNDVDDFSKSHFDKITSRAENIKNTIAAIDSMFGKVNKAVDTLWIYIPNYYLNNARLMRSEPESMTVSEFKERDDSYRESMNKKETFLRDDEQKVWLSKWNTIWENAGKLLTDIASMGDELKRCRDTFFASKGEFLEKLSTDNFNEVALHLDAMISRISPKNIGVGYVLGESKLTFQKYVESLTAKLSEDKLEPVNEALDSLISKDKWDTVYCLRKFYKMKPSVEAFVHQINAIRNVKMPEKFSTKFDEIMEINSELEMRLIECELTNERRKDLLVRIDNEMKELNDIVGAKA